MGMFGDIRATQKAAKQMSAGYDPAAQLRNATARMALMTQSLQSAPADTAAPTVQAEAIVVQAGSTGITMNDQPVVALSLLVVAQGQPPVPVNVRVPVPLIELASVRAGSTLVVHVDPARLDRLRMPWQGPVV